MVSTSNPTYTIYGPFAFDEVFNQDALRDIYEFWLCDNDVKYAKETMAAWSMRLKEHGFYYNIYIRKREPGMRHVPSDIIQFKMPIDAFLRRVSTTISLVNVRDDLFKSINKKQIAFPYTDSPMSHINYLMSSYGETFYTVISYALPSFKELYSVPTTEGNKYVITEPIGNGQYRTHTMYGDEETNDCVTSECNVCLWMKEDEPMDDDSARQDMLMDIYQGRWGIITENYKKNTALIMREYSSYFKKGKTIETGSLYHRALYYSDIHSGYWINRKSKLYRLIKQYNHPNPAGSWIGFTTTESQ